MKDEAASQFKPRLVGVILVVVAILLLLLGFLIVVFGHPAPGQYYSRSVVVLVTLIMLIGYGLFFPGVWKVFVGPGVGTFVGLLKVVAVGVMLAGGVLGSLYGLMMYAALSQPGSERSSGSSSGSDWD